MKNLRMVEAGGELTMPLKQLNSNCEFKKKYELWCDVRDGVTLKKLKGREASRKYFSKPEVRERKRKYDKEYYSKPEVKIRKRKYDKERYQRPEVRAMRIKYLNDPIVKARRKAYHNSSKIKAMKREYYLKTNRKVKMREYMRKKSYKQVRRCKEVGCEKIIRPNNKSGYCNKCFNMNRATAKRWENERLKRKLNTVEKEVNEQ